MAIKKVSSGYEVRFRFNDRGSREHKKVFPKKAECERFQRYTIAQHEAQASHVLSHTFASYFIMIGGNILTLQKRLNHTDIK